MENGGAISDYYLVQVHCCLPVTTSAVFSSIPKARVLPLGRAALYATTQYIYITINQYSVSTHIFLLVYNPPV